MFAHPLIWLFNIPLLPKALLMWHFQLSLEVLLPILDIPQTESNVENNTNEIEESTLTTKQVAVIKQIKNMKQKQRR